MKVDTSNINPSLLLQWQLGSCLNDPYVVLQMDYSSPTGDLRDTYERLVMQWHPDRYRSHRKSLKLSEPTPEEIKLCNDIIQDLERANQQLKAIYKSMWRRRAKKNKKDR